MGRKTNIRHVAIGEHRGTFLLPSEECSSVFLNPSECTLFRLFLAHPEGIASDDLMSHWEELCRIYSQESVFDDSSRQEDALEALCSESRRSFYPVVSRIKARISLINGSTERSYFCFIFLKITQGGANHLANV